MSDPLGFWSKAQLSNVACLWPSPLLPSLLENRRSLSWSVDGWRWSSRIQAFTILDSCLGSSSLTCNFVFILERTLVLFTTVEIKKTRSGGVSFSLNPPQSPKQEGQGCERSNSAGPLVSSSSSFPSSMSAEYSLSFSEPVSSFTKDRSQFPPYLSTWLFQRSKEKRNIKYFANTQTHPNLSQIHLSPRLPFRCPGSRHSQHCVALGVP